MEKLSVYIHIPFCARKCLYCDFLSASAGITQQKAYIQALLHEIEQEAKHYVNHIVATVFIGGGTPSLLEAEDIERILQTLHSYYHFAGQVETTIEVNPGSVTRQKLARYRQSGINRLSIGAQSLKDEELRALGRIHDARAFFETYQLARECGFENINVDIMSALPGQSLSSYMETVQKVVALKPEHISAYSLLIEEGTPFYAKYHEQEKKQPMLDRLPDEDTERSMYVQTKNYLAEFGYERYEISNYARKGYACRHNITYWTRGDYVGFGIGAASMVQNRRWSNERDRESYVNHFSQTGEGEWKENKQELSVQEQIEETMFLGLRLVQGVNREAFARTFGKSVEDVYGDLPDRLVQDKVLLKDTYLHLTDYGMDVSNYVMAQFLLD